MKYMRANRYMNSFVTFIVATMLVTVSCNKEEANLPATITLDKDVISLVLGTSETLTPTVTPSVPNPDIIWTSSNPEVAIVTGGKVQSVGIGRAVINAKMGNSTSFCDVIVTDEFIPVTGISLNKTDLEMRIGDQEQLVATLAPYEATNRRKRWSSSNENIVSVHEINGTLTAHALGEVVITVKTLDGSYTASCTVAVLPIIELFTPPSENIKLHPTDASKKVPFTWNNIEGIKQYILTISTSNLFEEENIVYSSIATENKLDIQEYALNEVAKEISGNTVKLYWTVKSGTQGIKVLPSTGTLNLIPDRREYLQLSPASATGMELRKMEGEYQYAITTTGQAYVNTLALTKNVSTDSTVISLKYKSNRNLTPATVVFMSSTGSVLGTSQKDISQSSEWKEWRIPHTALPTGWGNVGDYLQLDFGNAPGYQIELNAIHFTGLSLEEQKEMYTPEILNIKNFNNQLAMLSHEDNYFKFIVTGGDSNATTVALTRKLPAGAVLFSFEYKSDKILANNLQVFLGPSLSEGRSIKAGTVPANSTGEWKEHVVDMTTLRGNNPTWGNPGDNLRIDFGETPSIDMTMEIRNIHFKFKD
ncbi:MAG: hypothetical protein BGO34_08055 [Bacteroidia bacterium 44-10]|nr:MAG: hypothetical protein BGO34_08055 [Bacteroidia bacterium 44-10]